MKKKECKLCKKEFDERLLTNNTCYKCEVELAIKSNKEFQIQDRHLTNL